MAGELWTPSVVEERLAEAAAVLHRLPEDRVQGYFSTWPPIVRDFWDAFGWHDVELRLGPPAPDAIDRMDEAFQWLHWLEPDETRLVWLRAEGVRWKVIGHRFGMDRTTAWRHWTGALIKIAARLNGARATKTLQQKSLRHAQRNLAN